MNSITEFQNKIEEHPFTAIAMGISSIFKKNKNDIKTCMDNNFSIIGDKIDGITSAISELGCNDTSSTATRLYKESILLHTKRSSFSSLVPDEVFEKWYNIASHTKFKRILTFKGSVGSGKDEVIENFVDYIADIKCLTVYRAIVDCDGNLSTSESFYSNELTLPRLRYGIGLEAIIKANELYNDAEDKSKAPVVVLQFNEYTLAQAYAIEKMKSFLSAPFKTITVDGVSYANTPNLIVIFNGNDSNMADSVNYSIVTDKAWSSRCFFVKDSDFNPAFSVYAKEVYLNYIKQTKPDLEDDARMAIEECGSKRKCFDMREFGTRLI